jgi:hypothetical protein
VLGFLLVLAVFLASPVVDGGDGFLSVPTGHSLLYDRDLSLEEFSDSPWHDRHYAVATVNDHTINYFPWLSAVFTAPTIAAWDAVSSLGIVPNSATIIDEGSVGPLHLLAGSIVAAAGAVMLGLLTSKLFELMGPNRSNWVLPEAARRYSLLSWIVITGLGTSLWSAASRSTGQHATSVLIAGAAMLFVVRSLEDQPGRGTAIETAGLGALLALAYWARPTNIILTAVACAVIGLRQRRLLVALMCGLAGTHLAMLCLNMLLLGQPLPPYFAWGRVGMHPGFGEAVLANTISPSRGLLVFSPFLLGATLLLLRSRRRLMSGNVATYALASGAGAIAILLAVSGFKESWWAGLSYGPRFMTETLVLIGPLALLGLFGPAATRGPRRARAAAAGTVLVILSILSHSGGALVPGLTCSNRRIGTEAPQSIWSWSSPQSLSGPVALVTGPEETVNRLCSD